MMTGWTFKAFSKESEETCSSTQNIIKNSCRVRIITSYRTQLLLLVCSIYRVVFEKSLLVFIFAFF